MPKPPVTPIFPRSNGPIQLQGPKCPENLPIRKMDSRDHILNSGGFYNRFNPEMPQQPQFFHSPTPTSNDLNCIAIAQHIENCPICSRLYDTDKTLYILAIIGLLILCFLMVKRIVQL